MAIYIYLDQVRETLCAIIGKQYPVSGTHIVVKQSSGLRAVFVKRGLKWGWCNFALQFCLHTFVYIFCFVVCGFPI